MGKDITWPEYFMYICDKVASRSKCLSRKIGCIIVKDGAIISTGYNGPPKGYFHCIGVTCPRQLKGYKSGEGLNECPAAHAESNAISQAAMSGVSVKDATLYLNTITPCKDCAGKIVNAGIKKVIYKDKGTYDTLGVHILKVCGVKLVHYREEE